MQPIEIYLAAVYTNSYMPGGNRYPKLNDAEKQIIESVKHHNILESYHYVNKQSFIDNMRINNAKVFLDSGAFSAHSLGAHIDLPTYCKYIQTNEDIIRKDGNIIMASVLDGIGDAQLTLDNQNHMEKLGVTPLPCFHFGEDEKFLKHYISNYEYITLGGLVPVSTKQAMKWLDRIWSKYLTDSSGNARLKVHGFGITTLSIMEAYPWFSCDSSSWIQAAAFGSVVTRDYGPISVSEKSPSRHTRNQHITTMSEIEMQHLRNMLISQGFDESRLSTVYESRAVYNLFGYMQINEKLNKGRTLVPSVKMQELF